MPTCDYAIVGAPRRPMSSIPAPHRASSGQFQVLMSFHEVEAVGIQDGAVLTVYIPTSHIHMPQCHPAPPREHHGPIPAHPSTMDPWHAALQTLHGHHMQLHRYCMDATHIHRTACTPMTLHAPPCTCCPGPEHFRAGPFLRAGPWGCLRCMARAAPQWHQRHPQPSARPGERLAGTHECTPLTWP